MSSETGMATVWSLERACYVIEDFEESFGSASKK